MTWIRTNMQKKGHTTKAVSSWHKQFVIYLLVSGFKPIVKELHERTVRR